MTQYQKLIERKRKLLTAEKWAEGVDTLHSHSLNSMWYEPYPDVEKPNKVLDIIYNSGRITRDGVEIVSVQLKGDALIDAWEQATHNQCICGTQNCEDEYTHTTHGY